MCLSKYGTIRRHSPSYAKVCGAARIEQREAVPIIEQKFSLCNSREFGINCFFADARCRIKRSLLKTSSMVYFDVIFFVFISEKLSIFSFRTSTDQSDTARGFHLRLQLLWKSSKY